MASSVSSFRGPNPVRLVQTRVAEARNSVRNSVTGMGYLKRRRFEHLNVQAALGDCTRLYEEAELRLAGMLVGENYTAEDARTWLSAAVANHRSCLDGLEEVGAAAVAVDGNNLTVLLTGALHSYDKIAAVEERNGRHVLSHVAFILRYCKLFIYLFYFICLKLFIFVIFWVFYSL